MRFTFYEVVGLTILHLPLVINVIFLKKGPDTLSKCPYSSDLIPTIVNFNLLLYLQKNQNFLFELTVNNKRRKTLGRG